MEVIKEYYNQKSLLSGINKRRRDNLLRILKGETNNKVILDVGCAIGLLAEFIKEKDNYIVGVDISPQAIEITKGVLDKAIVLDIENEELPFDKNYFDTIIISEVLSHLFLPDKVLLKLGHYLKNDGVMVITTPNFMVFSNRLRILLGKFDYIQKSLVDNGVIRFLNYYLLKKMLKEAGFKIIQEEHVIHPRIPQWIGEYFPNLFAFQLVVKVKKI